MADVECHQRSTVHPSPRCEHCGAFRCLSCLGAFRIAKPLFDSLEYVVLVGWILKDLGWVTLCIYVAWPAALTALYAEVHHLALGWRGASIGLRVHRLAEVCWLLGNAVWMAAEFMFDLDRRSSSSLHLPWYVGIFLDANKETYLLGVVACRAILSLGLATLLGFYLLCAIGALRLDAGARETPNSCWAFSSTSASESLPEGEAKSSSEAASGQRPSGLVFGLVPPGLYAHMFIGPWIAKDLAWSLELKLPVLLFGTITLALAMDCLRRFGGEIFRSELLWVFGNCVWCSELWSSGATPPGWRRILAALLLSWGAAVLLVGLAKRHLNGQAPGLPAAKGSRGRGPSERHGHQ